MIITLREFGVNEIIQQVLRGAGRLALVLVSLSVLWLAFCTAIISALARAATHHASRAGIHHIFDPFSCLDHKRCYAWELEADAACGAAG